MTPTDLAWADHVLPALAAIPFILIMSLVPEPARRHYNAVFVGGASAAYLGSSFGVWELPYVAVAGGVVSYLGLRSYRYIALAWFMHSAWDLAHHLYGTPIWPYAPTSSWGCMIFDAVIALWFVAGAPSAWTLARHGTARRLDGLG